MFNPHHVSHFTCLVSTGTSNLSHIYFFLYKILKPIGSGSVFNGAYNAISTDKVAWRNGAGTEAIFFLDIYIIIKNIFSRVFCFFSIDFQQCINFAIHPLNGLGFDSENSLGQEVVVWFLLVLL